MSTSDKEYSKMAEKASPNSPKITNCIKAFIFGGAICTFGQFLNFIFERMGFSEDYVKALTPSVLIIITAILTGIGVFDKIAKHAGAGTIVPITGFANSVVSPAMEFKSEGFVYGLAAKMFVVAGPIIVFGIVSSVAVGLVYYIIGLF